ncbi:hypothetical protein [Streptomyces sp. BBFR109]|uniref:hypothetical protein n=1 Tax=Streptomyces sp. BBFR109 TaxID=3448172 RepID=UPI003F76CC19
MEKLKFDAEVKEVNSKKTASLDVVHKVVFYTDNPAVLALAALPGDAMVKVTVEVDE